MAQIDKILDRNRPLGKFSSFLGGRISSRYCTGGGRLDPAAQRVLHLLHTVPARGEPGDAPHAVRVPEPLGRADGSRCRQRLAVRRGDRRRGSDAPVSAPPRGRVDSSSRRASRGRRRASSANYAAGPGLTVEEIPFDPRTGNLDLAFVTLCDRVPRRLRTPRRRAERVRSHGRGTSGSSSRSSADVPLRRVGRPALAHGSRPARRLRGGRGGRGGPGVRDRTLVRRAAPRPLRVPQGTPADDARAHRRCDRGRRGGARLLPHAPDPGTAHPAVPGHFQHLHEPVAHGRSRSSYTRAWSVLGASPNSRSPSPRKRARSRARSERSRGSRRLASRRPTSASSRSN